MLSLRPSFLLPFLLATCLVPIGSYAQPSSPPSSSDSPAATDRTAVRQAALNYVEALYQVDSTRVIRSVHPELVKYGYFRSDGTYRGTPMTFTELKKLAMSWNKDQKRVDPDTATKEIVVLDVLDKTASAKIVAHWGIDYMHLAKTDGKWMIRQVLWQSHPPQR